MTGVHGLEHVQCFLTATLADDDPVRAHTQGIDYERTNRDTAFAFDVGRSGFQPDQIPVGKFQFRGVFDRDNTFAFRNELAQYIQQSRFTGSRTAGDQHVLRSPHGFFQKQSDILGHTAETDQVVDRQFFLGKFTNGQGWTVQRQRRNHRIDAGTVGQTRIHHRTGIVNMTAQRFHDPLNDGHQMAIIEKTGAGFINFTLAFHKNQIRTVDHDFVHIFRTKQGRKRTETGQLVHQRLAELILRRFPGQFMAQIPQNLIQRLFQLRDHFIAIHGLHGLFSQVQFRQNMFMDLLFQGHHVVGIKQIRFAESFFENRSRRCGFLRFLRFS